MLDRFLEAKEKVDGGAAANQDEQENDCINAFHALTSVRAMLADGLRGGAPPKMLGMMSLGNHTDAVGSGNRHGQGIIYGRGHATPCVHVRRVVSAYRS